MESLDNKVGLFTNVVGFLPSPLKIALYRMLGAKIGKNVSIGIGATIVARSFKNVRIGDYSIIDSFSMIICDKVEMGEGCHIGPFVWIYGGSLLWMIPRECRFKIGDMTYVGARAVINVTEDVTIGDYAGIGAGVTIYTHGFQSSYIDGEPRKEAPVTIGDRAWVQPKTFIVPGVTIGEGSIVASGSIVTKDIPAGVFAVGSPAKVKSPVSDLKKGNTLPERESRAIKVLNDYFEAIRFFKKDKAEIRERGANRWLLSVKRLYGLSKRNYAITYVSSLDAASMEELKKDSRDTAGNKLLISLQKITPEHRAELGNMGYNWIDLSGKHIKEREGLPPLMYMFLRDYYGVALLTAGHREQ